MRCICRLAPANEVMQVLYTSNKLQCMLVLLHVVICHSTLASGIGTSHDRKYKLTIGVKLKKGLRKPCHCFNHIR